MAVIHVGCMMRPNLCKLRFWDLSMREVASDSMPGQVLLYFGLTVRGGSFAGILSTL